MGQFLSGQSILVAHPSPDLYGSDRMMIESVRGFIEAGARVVVAMPHDGPGMREVERWGARTVICPTPRLRKAAATPRGLVSLTREAIEGAWAGGRVLSTWRPTAVYVSTLTNPLWLALASVRDLPTLCHVHEAEQHASPVLRWGLVSPLVLASTVVVNSEFARSVLAMTSSSIAERAKLIYNGVAGPEDITPVRTNPDSPVRLLYVGRLSERKGPHIAVQALTHLQAAGIAAELDILGAVFEGNESYYQRLMADVHRLPQPMTVRIHGFSPSIWPHVENCDIAVVPSTVDEPFGNTAVEAVLGGRPVIASDLAGLKEATKGVACAWLTEPGSAQALSTTVQQVLSQWSAIPALVTKGRATVQHRHSPALYRQDIAQAMADTVRQGRSSTRRYALAEAR